MYVVSKSHYACEYADATPLPLFMTASRKAAYRFMLHRWSSENLLLLHVMKPDEEYDESGRLFATDDANNKFEYAVGCRDDEQEIIDKAKEMDLPEIIDKMKWEEEASRDHIASLYKKRIEAFRLDKCPSLSAEEVKSLFKKHIDLPYYKGEPADWTGMEKDAQILLENKEK